MNNNRQIKNTKSTEYTQRLVMKEAPLWKKILNVQAPYRWNIRRLQPGYTLDVGCGLGRNLIHLNRYGVGIDHNPDSIELARKSGIIAFTPEKFIESKFNKLGHFDSILFAHVAEHMIQQEAVALLRTYLPLLKKGGKVIIICPQEAGYKSDTTHIEFMDFTKLSNINEQLGLSILQKYSFPFPRLLGYLFTYNEFVVVSCKNHPEENNV